VAIVDPVRDTSVGAAALRSLASHGVDDSKWNSTARLTSRARERCGATAWHPSRQLLRSLRDYTQARARGGPVGAVRAKWAVLRHRFWSVVTGAEIALNSADIADGLMLPHPNGIVIHPDVVIGADCILFQQVTLGTGRRPGVPRLGAHVEVGGRREDPRRRDRR